MIKCPDCKKIISKKAESCPSCGCPIEAKANMIFQGFQLIRFFVFIIVAFALFKFLQSSDREALITNAVSEIKGIFLEQIKK